MDVASSVMSGQSQSMSRPNSARSTPHFILLRLIMQWHHCNGRCNRGDCSINALILTIYWGSILLDIVYLPLMRLVWFISFGMKPIRITKRQLLLVYLIVQCWLLSTLCFQMFHHRIKGFGFSKIRAPTRKPTELKVSANILEALLQGKSNHFIAVHGETDK